MPPKKKKDKKAEKPGKLCESTSNGARKLRPKKATDFKQLNSGKKPEKAALKVQNKKTGGDKESEKDNDAVSLTPNSSDDDFENEDQNRGSNTSNSAMPEMVEQNDSDTDMESADDRESSGRESSDDKDLDERVERMVGKCLKKYRKHDRKKLRKNRKKRRRRESDSSEWDSESESATGSEGSSSSESDGSYERRKSRKRRHKTQRKEKRKRGKSKAGKPMETPRVDETAIQSPSQSTVYTRAVKSPEANRKGVTSDSDSCRSGHLNSDADTDEFLRSLESSFNHSTPIAGRRERRDRRRSETPARDAELGRKSRDDGSAEDLQERRRRDDQARDRSDEVIRDIQRNKAELAKPAGEWKRELKTLLIDMKHFHLTSHVDKKIREAINGGDYTIDFKRLVPRSRSRCKVDSSMHMINKDGVSCFVPADHDNVKDITSYKQWEVAFKVFMGIYIAKWPGRSEELLQYSHNIQTASAMYPWENVFNYDIAMREIHTEHQDRLWGKICHHTWAVELGEPTQKTTFQNPNMSVNSQGTRGPRKICWRFNKGKCTFGASCEFDHRCAVCGARGHGRSTCYKRGKNDKNKDNRRDIKKEKKDD